MNKNVFGRCATIRDIRNNGELIRSYNEEQGRSSDLGVYTVEGTDLKDLKYIGSINKNGMIHSNLFQFASEDGKLVGLAMSPCLSTDITPVIEPNYLSLSMVHKQCWMCTRKDSMYDVWVNGHIYGEPFISYDTLDLAGQLYFLQLDTNNWRSLVCLDMQDLNKGYYMPKSLEDFSSWFQTVVARRGYSGALDVVNVSDLFRVYYEVQNCIFMNGNFRPLKLSE